MMMLYIKFLSASLVFLYLTSIVVTNYFLIVRYWITKWMYVVTVQLKLPYKQTAFAYGLFTSVFVIFILKLCSRFRRLPVLIALYIFFPFCNNCTQNFPYRIKQCAMQLYECYYFRKFGYIIDMQWVVTDNIFYGHNK